MCPNCTTTALMVIAGFFLTPWRALISLFFTFRRIHCVE
jgi:hypothetical protein